MIHMQIQANNKASSDGRGGVAAWKEVRSTGACCLRTLSDTGRPLRWIKPRMCWCFVQALLASNAVETLISTCLSERIDSSLEPLLAALFTAIAHDGSAEKRKLAEVLAAAVVMLAQAMDHTSQANVDAAQHLLKLLLGLLQSPDEAPSQPRPLQPEPVEDAELEKLIAQKAHQLAAAKLPM